MLCKSLQVSLIPPSNAISRPEVCDQTKDLYDIATSSVYLKSICLFKIGFDYDDASNFCADYEMVLFDHSTSTDAKNLLLKLSETNFGIESDYNLWIKGKSGTKCTTSENSGPGGSWIVNSKQDCSQSFWFYCEYNKFASWLRKLFYNRFMQN